MSKSGIAFSGSSTKIQFHFGVAHELHLRGADFQYYNGCSGGSIAELFLAVGKFTPEVIDTFLNVGSKRVFNIEPMNKKGNITLHGKSRFVTGKPSFGKQDALLELIKTHFTEDDYKELKRRKKKVSVTVWNCNTKLVEYVNISRTSMTYEVAMKYVLASAAIPMAVMPVKIGKSWYYDGGVVDHNGGKFLAEKKDVSDLITVWSRPDELSKIREDENYGWQEWEPGPIWKNGWHVFNGVMYNTSFTDEELIDALCRANKIEQHKIFPDYVLMEDLYKFDPDLQRSMYYHGREQATSLWENLF